MPVRIVTTGGEPVREVTHGGDPVRIVTSGISNPVRGISVTPTPSSLLTGLQAFWNLDEAGGNAVDSLGGYDLTDNGGVTQALPVSAATINSRSFAATSNQYLSYADAIALRIVGDTTFSAWCYIDGVPASGGIIGKWDGDSVEYTIWYDSANVKFCFFNGATHCHADIPSPAVTATWYHIVAWWDSAANDAYIQIDNGVIYTANFPAGISASTGTFVVGSVLPTTLYWNGRIDAVGKWSRVLTPAERLSLYNGGLGLQYPF